MDPSRAGSVAAGVGGEDEIHAAYLLHGPELFRFVLRGLGDRGAAEDVIQETFIRAWRARDGYDPRLASLRVWLFAIARNAMLDHVRAAQVRPWQSRLVDPTTATAMSTGAAPDHSEAAVTAWVVEEALARLTPEHRDALVQTQLRGRPHDEVAAELGIPVGTLRSRIFYGLKALRNTMDEMGVTP